MRRALGRALETLPPYSALLCAVRRGGCVGLAAADPYLSATAPVALVAATLPALHGALRPLLRSSPASLIVLAEARGASRCPARSRLHATTDRARLARTLARLAGSTRGAPQLPLVESEYSRPALEEVRAHQEAAEENAWQQLPLITHPQRAPIPLDLEAAIMLQSLLDAWDPTGWANTFG